MAIRINLLAEAQMLEELRRRDPVKRAIWVGVFLVFLMFAWWSSIWAKRMWAKGELTRVQNQLTTRTNEFAQALDNQKKLNEITSKLGALQQLATNRLLYGTLLNALQQTTVDDVQLLRFRTDQNFSYNEEIKPKTNASDRVIPGKPASMTEKIVVTLDARDTGADPGGQINKFKRVIADAPYFQSVLNNSNDVRLASLSPPQFVDGKPFVQFTIECRYPERTR